MYYFRNVKVNYNTLSINHKKKNFCFIFIIINSPIIFITYIHNSNNMKKELKLIIVIIKLNIK